MLTSKNNLSDKLKDIDFWKKNEFKYAGDSVSKEIIRMSKKYIGNRVLDAGAGSGALIEQIRSSIGMDLVSRHRRMLRGDITHIPFKEKSFDTVFANEIFEHLNNGTLEKGLEEIHRVLDNNGTIIITCPNEENLKDNTVSCPKCQHEFHRWGHVRSLDGAAMDLLLQKKGFTIEKMSIVPLGFTAEYRFLKHFLFIFRRFGLFTSGNLFVIAVKRK